MAEGESVTKKLKTDNGWTSGEETDMADPSPSVQLSELESKLFTILKAAAERLGKGTVLRVAGGWVRDKLLGRDSDDIDVALDNISGAAFAEAVNEYLTEQGMETHRIGVIEANPEQSKHLETAKVLILGVWVDFTNLRTETYQSDSRIPTIAFGTAEEDAHRRDFTINSLFYNLNTSSVEDWTGCGRDDLLRQGVIRTPLEPRTTFLDDPLRILRAVRFAARFDFTLHEDIIAAGRDADLLEALRVKVSRERVGLELEGMLSGKSARPQLALPLLASLGLADAVFLRPPSELGPLQRDPPPLEEGEKGAAMEEDEGWDRAALAAVRAMAILILCRQQQGEAGCDPEALESSPAFRAPLVDHRLHFLSAMLLPWAGAYYLDKKKKRQEVPAFIVRESLKLRNKDASDVATLLSLVPRFRALSHKGREATRVDVGLLLKEAQDLWPISCDVACASELCSQGASGSAWTDVVGRYASLTAHVQELGLQECWKLKPLLNGQAVMKRVGVPQGPLMAKAMQEQYRWQLEHPGGEETAIVDHLKSWLALATAESGLAAGAGGKS